MCETITKRGSKCKSKITPHCKRHTPIKSTAPKVNIEWLIQSRKELKNENIKLKYDLDQYERNIDCIVLTSDRLRGIRDESESYIHDAQNNKTYTISTLQHFKHLQTNSELLQKSINTGITSIRCDCSDYMNDLKILKLQHTATMEGAERRLTEAKTKHAEYSNKIKTLYTQSY